MVTFTSINELFDAAGADLGTSRSIEIPQSRIIDFAEITGDRQWIHVDEARAAEGPFGTTIVHGYFTLSLLGVFLKDLIDVTEARSSVNYGLNRVRFPDPVPSGSTLSATGKILAVTPISSGAQVELSVEINRRGASKPSCVASPVIRYNY
jgi:acyl dehydratase